MSWKARGLTPTHRWDEGSVSGGTRHLAWLALPALQSGFSVNACMRACVRACVRACAPPPLVLGNADITNLRAPPADAVVRHHDGRSGLSGDQDRPAPAAGWHAPAFRQLGAACGDACHHGRRQSFAGERGWYLSPVWFPVRGGGDENPPPPPSGRAVARPSGQPLHSPACAPLPRRRSP